MLHWSQEASTGWTRNSWRGSIAKVEDVPLDGVRSRETSAPARTEEVASAPPIYHPRLGLRKGARAPPPALAERVGPLAERARPPVARLTATVRAATLRRGRLGADRGGQEDSGP